MVSLRISQDLKDRLPVDWRKIVVALLTATYGDR
jgi:hypothetical protein